MYASIFSILKVQRFQSIPEKEFVEKFHFMPRMELRTLCVLVKHTNPELYLTSLCIFIWKLDMAKLPRLDLNLRPS